MKELNVYLLPTKLTEEVVVLQYAAFVCIYSLLCTLANSVECTSSLSTNQSVFAQCRPGHSGREKPFTNHLSTLAHLCAPFCACVCLY